LEGRGGCWAEKSSSEALGDFVRLRAQPPLVRGLLFPSRGSADEAESSAIIPPNINFGYHSVPRQLQPKRPAITTAIKRPTIDPFHSSLSSSTISYTKPSQFVQRCEPGKSEDMQHATFNLPTTIYRQLRNANPISSQCKCLTSSSILMLSRSNRPPHSPVNRHVDAESRHA